MKRWSPSTPNRGLKKGRNGTHEIADGHISLVNASSKASVMDTQNVQLAMNVSSKKDPRGLPREIPLTRGQQVEVEGLYIPGAKANAPNHEAVIHFTHAPDGYVIAPDGSQFS